jgi:hypothetical protein
MMQSHRSSQDTAYAIRSFPLTLKHLHRRINSKTISSMRSAFNSATRTLIYPLTVTHTPAVSLPHLPHTSPTPTCSTPRAHNQCTPQPGNKHISPRPTIGQLIRYLSLSLHHDRSRASKLYLRIRHRRQPFILDRQGMCGVWI